ncbi:MAG: DoxX family protein [Betaproteobacteria bacterium]|jgi:putative oxidoreductase|nr:DoxX family protein [Betaproteobacteria bacterium]
MKLINLKNYWQQLPDFSLSHILLRIPLAIVFIQQGLSKFPFDPATGAALGLPSLVWWFVCYGEIAAGVGLLVGALTTIPRLRDIPIVAELGDLITRFSGITMCCVITGVIWVVIKPESLMQFILNDNLHLFLWVGGLYFALRGNWAVAVQKQTPNLNQP